MDVICQAKSGMGKTAVFVLSTLQQIEPVAGQVAALILCHTRELAYQVIYFSFITLFFKLYYFLIRKLLFTCRYVMNLKDLVLIYPTSKWQCFMVVLVLKPTKTCLRMIVLILLLAHLEGFLLYLGIKIYP